MLEQETNAYAVLPDSQWRGYRPPADPPAPAPGTWGEPAPMPDAVTLARLEGDLMGKVHVLASDPKDRLAGALARLGQAFMTREFSRNAADAEKHSPEITAHCRQPARTGRPKQGRRIEQEAAGGACLTDADPSGLRMLRASRGSRTGARDLDRRSVTESLAHSPRAASWWQLVKFPVVFRHESPTASTGNALPQTGEAMWGRLGLRPFDQ